MLSSATVRESFSVVGVSITIGTVLLGPNGKLEVVVICPYQLLNHVTRIEGDTTATDQVTSPEVSCQLRATVVRDLVLRCYQLEY